MPDVFHTIGNDIVVSANGDLLTAESVAESEQRVLRRLFTNNGDYIWQPGYGAGLPSKIGDPFTVAAIQSIVAGQMYLEKSVVRNPAPQVNVQSFNNGMFVNIKYTEADSGAPVVLDFEVSPQGLHA